MKILETSHLLLREFAPQDVDALAEVLSDPKTMRYYPAPYDRAGVEQWIERNRQRYHDDGVGLWAMQLSKTSDFDTPRFHDQASEVQGSESQSFEVQGSGFNKVIGDCGITVQHVEGEPFYEIGYHLRRDLWGRGLATEAAIACRDWAFSQLQVDRLISLIRPENLPSRRVAERVGMSIWKEVNWRGLPHYIYSIPKPPSAV